MPNEYQVELTSEDVARTQSPHVPNSVHVRSPVYQL